MMSLKLFSVLITIYCIRGDTVVNGNIPYANNPFLNNLDVSKPAIPIGPPHHRLKQNLNQYQVALVLPPGHNQPVINQLQPVATGEYTGIPHQGGIWINIPNNNPYYGQLHTTPPPPPQYVPTVASNTHRPAITSPPIIQHPPVPENNDLLRYCLKPVGQFPSKYCNKFVNCWEGNAVEQFCPPTLVFGAKGYCDYDYNVDCGGRPIGAFPAYVPETGHHWPSDGSYVPDKITPAPVYPIVDYITTTSKPPLITLPTHPTAPPTATYPVHPPIAVLPPQPQPNPALKKYCLKPRGQFPGTSCSKYVNCWDDIVMEQECPETLVFNGAKGYCDYPYNVNCYDKPVTRAQIMESGCPLSDGTFRNGNDCGKYYTCVNNRIIGNYACTTGYVFNDVIGVCDHPHKVDCTREPYVYFPLKMDKNILHRVPADIFDPTVACTPGTVIRLDPGCISAAVCRDGVTEVIQCPQGLAYDSRTDKCLQPHLATC